MTPTTPQIYGGLPDTPELWPAKRPKRHDPKIPPTTNVSTIEQVPCDHLPHTPHWKGARALLVKEEDLLKAWQKEQKEQTDIRLDTETGTVTLMKQKTSPMTEPPVSSILPISPPTPLPQRQDKRKHRFTEDSQQTPSPPKDMVEISQVGPVTMEQSVILHDPSVQFVNPPLSIDQHRDDDYPPLGMTRGDSILQQSLVGEDKLLVQALDEVEEKGGRKDEKGKEDQERIPDVHTLDKHTVTQPLRANILTPHSNIDTSPNTLHAHHKDTQAQTDTSTHPRTFSYAQALRGGGLSKGEWEPVQEKAGLQGTRGEAEWEELEDIQIEKKRIFHAVH
ncbi:UNVERIFIED_CONTAM: hypothetical protein K2H54_000645 [Gekko kuhli]